MENNRVIYYISQSGDNPVKDFLDSLLKIQKAKVFRIFQHYQKYGIEAIYLRSKKLTGTPFWEIRILGKDNIRVIYILPERNRLLVLHGFVKKSQKTPVRELNMALRRYKNWVDRNS